MVVSMLFYIAAVLAANYTATWFMPLPIFGMVSVGTLIFGVTFTQRDRVHRFGRKAVYAMILVAAVGMVLESLFLSVEWRIILASFIAIVLSEAADTEIYQQLLHRSCPAPRWDCRGLNRPQGSPHKASPHRGV